jgi:hypothetical protein
VCTAAKYVAANNVATNCTAVSSYVVNFIAIFVIVHALVYLASTTIHLADTTIHFTVTTPLLLLLLHLLFFHGCLQLRLKLLHLCFQLHPLPLLLSLLVLAIHGTL